MSLYSSLALAAIAAFLITLAGSGVLLRLLGRRAILDQPNERSSHVVATPRGAGIAVLAALLICGGGIAYAVGGDGEDARSLVGILVLATLLGGVSWLDDVRTLSAAPRLLAQAVAVALGLALLPGDSLVFQGLLPGWLDTVFTALAWLWFVNLYNFMDGIDGLTAVETAAIGAGLALAGMFGAAALPIISLLGAVLFGAALGFLAWNRPPARIFLGDVGAVPLGFVLGWLLIELAIAGHWAAALLLPLYYLGDATITLMKRLVRREAVWQAHRSHFYQQAVQALEGRRPALRTRAHSRICIVIALVNVGLAAAALVAVSAPEAALAALLSGAVAVAALLWYLASRKPLSGPDR